MSSVVYYFSGTGNSLWIAKEIQKNIEDTKLIPITTIVDQEQIKIEDEYIGIVYPVYCNGLPEVVERFINKLDISKDSYVYAIASLGAKTSSSFTYIDKAIDGKLSFAGHITMPDSYIRIFNSPKEEDIKNKLDNAIGLLSIYIKKIKGKKKEDYLKQGSLKRVGGKILRDLWKKNLYKADKSFEVLSTCTSCGICESICPVQNIELKDKKPIWLGHCQDCMACINACPVKAIQIGKKTIKKGRYLNPNIRIKDMIINR